MKQLKPGGNPLALHCLWYIQQSIIIVCKALSSNVQLGGIRQKYCQRDIFMYIMLIQKYQQMGP